MKKITVFIAFTVILFVLTGYGFCNREQAQNYLCYSANKTIYSFIDEFKSTFSEVL